MPAPLLPLFPAPEKPPLVGIARLASEGESLREGHNVEYFTLPHRAKEPRTFWWVVALYYLGALLFVGLYLHQTGAI